MKTFKNFVNGEWVDAKDGRTTPIINPATGEQYAEAVLSGGVLPRWSCSDGKRLSNRLSNCGMKRLQRWL